MSREQFQNHASAERGVGLISRYCWMPLSESVLADCGMFKADNVTHEQIDGGQALAWIEACLKRVADTRARYSA